MSSKRHTALKLAAACGLVLASASAAQATLYTYVGPDGGNWRNASGVPNPQWGLTSYYAGQTAGDDALIDKALTVNYIGTGSSIGQYLNNLTINNAGAALYFTSGNRIGTAQSTTVTAGKIVFTKGSSSNPNLGNAAAETPVATLSNSGTIDFQSDSAVST